MNPFTLIECLSRTGVTLAVNGGKLTYDAPAGMMTPRFLDAMREHKPILLALASGDWGVAAIAMIDRIPDPDQRESLRFQFEERAGIAEFDGGMDRREAEQSALGHVLSEIDRLDIRQSEIQP
jgi:hypothetical protein